MRHVLLCRMLFAAAVLLPPAHALAADPTHVPSAHPKSPGVVAPTVLSPELAEVIRAQGAMRLENPVSPAKYYGYNDDKPNHVPIPPLFNSEAHKTTSSSRATSPASTARVALDSAYMFDVRKDYSDPANQPIRILAQGRDPSATIDAGTPGLGNDGDNEITGFHVSNGDPSVGGILGAKNPRPFEDGWRVFYTQQHGDNVTWEIIPNPWTDGGERMLDRDDDDRD